MVFYWSQGDSNYPQVSRILLSVMADHINDGVHSSDFQLLQPPYKVLSKRTNDI